jgi:inner membrane protein
MPTVMTHGVVALALGAGCTGFRRMPLHFWALSAAVSVLPDADSVAFSLGLPPASIWAHRGLSHSLGAAAVVGLAATPLLGQAPRWSWWRRWMYLTAVMASHGVLDACTNGGSGIAFLWPLATDRYFFPWRPLEVSPIGWDFLSHHGWRTTRSELVWVWLPLGLAVAAGRLRRRRVRPHLSG